MDKKIKYILTVLVLVIVALGVYFVPQIKEKQEEKALETISQANLAFVNKVLEEFNNTKKASLVAQKVCDEMNKIAKNPYDKNALAYTFEKNCKACTSVEYDDSIDMVIITSYDKKGALNARTVIKPPSFVTYTKEDINQKGENNG